MPWFMVHYLKLHHGRDGDGKIGFAKIIVDSLANTKTLHVVRVPSIIIGQ